MEINNNLTPDLTDEQIEAIGVDVLEDYAFIYQNKQLS